MTKPEFDRLYCEKLSHGLNFPLNDLIQAISDSQNYQKTSEILGHILAHQMAYSICGTIGSESVHVGNYQINQQSHNPKCTIQLQFDIYDNSTL